MAVASIEIGGVAGRPAQTAVAGPAVNVNLTNDDNTGVVSWAWTIVFKPAGSTTTLSDPAIANPVLGPLDVEGTYWIRLAVNGGTGDWQADPLVDEIVLRVRPASGVQGSAPAPGETVQGGAQGWADETTGLNDLIDKLLAATTLQGVYNASTPPQILATAAKGPVDLRRDVGVGVGNILQLHSVTAGFVHQWDNLGRYVVTSDLTVGGRAGLHLDAPAAAVGSWFFLFENSLGIGGDPVQLQMMCDGTIYHNSHAAAGYGWTVAANGGSDIFKLLGDNGIAYVRSNGALAIDCAGVGSTYGLHVQERVGGLLPLFRADHANPAAPFFQIAYDGSVSAQATDVLVSPAAYDFDARGFANYWLRARDGSGNRFFGITVQGGIYLRGDLAAAGTGVLWRWDTIDVAASYVLLMTLGAATPFYGISAHVFTTHVIEGSGVPNASADASGYWQTWASAAAVNPGIVRNGFRVDAGTLVMAGGTFRAFKAEVPTQANAAFHVGSGAAGATPFAGQCRFGVADAVTRQSFDAVGALAVPCWRLDALTATGVGSAWVVENIGLGAGAARLAVALHVPPGATLVDVTIHVFDAAAGGSIDAYLIRTDALSGAASADQQTQLATATTGAAGEQDLVLTPGVPQAVPRGEVAATAQFAYFLVITGDTDGDSFFCGVARYTYAELLLGN